MDFSMQFASTQATQNMINAGKRKGLRQQDETTSEPTAEERHAAVLKAQGKAWSLSRGVYTIGEEDAT